MFASLPSRAGGRSAVLAGVLLTFFSTWVGDALAQSHEVHGIVRENDEIETPLWGANVYVPALAKGATASFNGRFELGRVPPGTYRLSVSFVGYRTLDTLISVPLPRELLLYLSVDHAALEEIIVESTQGRDLEVQTPASVIDVAMLPLRDVPRLLGEADLFRVIQNLPGVKSESEYSGGLFVRGGRSDQNLVLMDGVPVYNPWHLFGLFSAFNSEALARITLNKGVFPARYGERLSSVLDIELQDGARRRGFGALNISPLSATLSYGQPLNQRTSLLFAARRTYLDPLFAFSDRSSSTQDHRFRTRYGFSDLNVKVAHRLPAGQELMGSVFWSHDRLTYADDYRTKMQAEDFGLELGWRNTTATFRYRHSGARWSLTHQAYAVFYQSETREEDISYWIPGEVASGASPPWSTSLQRRDVSGKRSEQRFRDLALSSTLDYELASALTSTISAQLIHRAFEDGNLRANSYFGDGAGEGEGEEHFARGDTLQTRGFDVVTTATLHFRTGPLRIDPGLRLQHYGAGTYTNVMPRVSLIVDLARGFAATAGYGHTVQYLHVLSSELTSVPTSRWFWSDVDLPPARAATATAGFVYQAAPGQELSVEGYYRRFRGLRAYSPLELYNSIEQSNLPLFSAQTLEGRGWAYGIEAFYKKTAGNLTGWLGYTLAWNGNQFDDLNLGRAFPTRTDQRHVLQVMLAQSVGSKWDVGLLFNLKSGQPATVPTEGYAAEADPLGIDDAFFGNAFVVSSTNNYRLPVYHRLDVSATRSLRLFGVSGDLTLSIVNVYNRVNPLSIDNRTTILIESDDRIRVQPRARSISQLPIIPMFSLRVHLGPDRE